jgi:5-methylcytosine-specific restriction endonuclease McrA
MNRKRLEGKLMGMVKAFVKERDNHTCQWCGRDHLKGFFCQASHVISIRIDLRLAYDPMNMKVLCTQCHAKYEGNKEAGKEWFKQKFPERFLYIEQQRIDNLKKGTMFDSWFEDKIKEGIK